MAGQTFIRWLNGIFTETSAVQSSSGSGDAGKIAGLDSGGKWDISMMPTGIGPDTATILASENLAAGDLVNVYNNAGTANVRKADASSAGKEAWGYVLSSVTSGSSGLVYFDGDDSALTGLTPGKQYLSATPGQCTTTVPTTSGYLAQVVGVATATGNLNFEPDRPIVLA